LLKASLESGILEVPELTEGTYRLMATDWDMETLKPLIECRNITLEVAK